MTDQTKLHDELRRQVLIELGRRPDILVENNPTGVFRHFYRHDKIKVGAPGRPDITGVWSVPIDTPHGTRYFALAFVVECKTGSATLQPNQRRWRERFEALGGHYVLARTVQDVKDAFPEEGGPPWVTA